ncbi:hypothetical protein [Mesonia sp.]|uniref:hypothetical protein n=1 Tax=Mesonia sp. TaxID=1960830 RepID=UPI003F9C6D18
MNGLRKLKFGAFALSLAYVFTACSSDDDNTVTTPTANEGSLKIAARASYDNSANRLAESVDLNSFIVNFKEIELELQDNDLDDDDMDNNSDANGFYDSDDDIELEGPFEIDLLAANSVQLVNIEIPNGIYEEIEFEFDKSENPESDLFGKSMELKGEINGVPFVFWHDFEEEIEIDYEDMNESLVIDNNTSEVLINFDLSAVLGATGMVDLSMATDNDGDGVIVISPQDEDGNNALAEALKEAIKAQIELMDDLD